MGTHFIGLDRYCCDESEENSKLTLTKSPIALAQGICAPRGFQPKMTVEAFRSKSHNPHKHNHCIPVMD